MPYFSIEPVASNLASLASSAERRVRDGLGSFSDHARIMVGRSGMVGIVPRLGLEFSLVS